MTTQQQRSRQIRAKAALEGRIERYSDPSATTVVINHAHYTGEALAAKINKATQELANLTRKGV